MTTHAHPLFVEYLSKVSLELTTEELTGLLNEARLWADAIDRDPAKQFTVLGALIYLARQERAAMAATKPEGPL